MARREMGSEELRAIKKSVNKEGTQMEEGEEGGAAVYVGTKEEVTKARQLAESEGRAPDLASYVVMHKEILASIDELQDYYVAEDFRKMPIGTMHLEAGDENTLLLYFKDSSSNLAKVEIDMSKIASLGPVLSKYWRDNTFNIVIEDLKKLGFIQYAPFYQWGPRFVEERIKKGRLAKIKNERKKGFAF